MPVKKDDSGQRWVEMELVVPGTPEQVWQAIATGSGFSAWFTRTAVDEHVGGKIHFDFAANGSSSGEVTVWEPPVRFGFVERAWSDGAPPVATEITVTGRAGGRCVVRMVHSLFASTDDWDDQIEGFEGGWPAFFEVLRVYLAHFAGMQAACALAMARVEAPQADIWKRLTEALGLAAADVDDAWRCDGVPESLSGSVERVQQSRRDRYLLLRIDAPAPATVLIGTYGAGDATNVSAALYHYGDDAARRVAASEAKWRDWLDETFKPAQVQAASARAT